MISLKQAMFLREAGFPQGKEIALHFNKHGYYYDYSCGIKTGEEMYSAPSEKELIEWLGRQAALRIHLPQSSSSGKYVIELHMTMLSSYDLTEALVNAVLYILKSCVLENGVYVNLNDSKQQQ